MKILMATMGLDIGGAETHIVELAKSLQRRGHTVLVASNGGIYVTEIEAHGIRHVQVPLHRRSVGCMLRSFFRLRRLIRRERPDVVHAHARIPGFVCGLVRRTLKFPFVTTAHWVFDTGGGLKYLTNWGEKTVAVSEDIKQYLIDNYGVPESDIFVTINGIDTERFSPENHGERVLAEFGLDPAAPVVAHVSRLDADRALAARRLIEAAPALDAGAPGVQILIAGGGTLLEELQAQAETVNRALGRACVVLTGPRSDIADFAGAGDVFVGVSRAALEAMAAARPVILAGNEGYMGLFTADRLEEARESNFCCRGFPETRAETLAADILAALALPEPERDAIGAAGRDVILEYYSVARMTDDCLAAYRAALPEKRVLISGYYGFRNAGDEAILASVCRSIAGLDRPVRVTVLSREPAETAAEYGCEAVYRFSLFRVLRALCRCDVLLSGGGSLLQDKTSTRSILYYLFLIRAAERLGKRVMLYANGIGPVTKSANRRRVRRAVERADVVTLRDKNSAEELRRMGVTRTDLVVTADPVMTMDPVPAAQAAALLADAGVPADTPFAAVSVRRWTGEETFCRQIAAICDGLRERFGLSVVFLSMQRPGDLEISEKIRGYMRGPAYLPDGAYTPEELMGMLGQAAFVLSMRLHALIFAARMAVPVLGMVYDPKMDYYLELLNMPSAGSVETLEAETALAAAADTMARRDALRDALRERAETLAAAAAENDRLLLALLGA